MKKSLFVSLQLTFVCVLIGCSVAREGRIPGSYRSWCRVAGVPELEAEFHSDHTFIYNFGDTISGTWLVKKDTLFLYAEEFEIETVSFEEAIDFIISNPEAVEYPVVINGQYTTAKGRDVYLIRGRNLLPMRENGFSRDNCFLERLQKGDTLSFRRRR